MASSHCACPARVIGRVVGRGADGNRVDGWRMGLALARAAPLTHSPARPRLGCMRSCCPRSAAGGCRSRRRRRRRPCGPCGPCHPWCHPCHPWSTHSALPAAAPLLACMPAALVAHNSAGALVRATLECGMLAARLDATRLDATDLCAASLCTSGLPGADLPSAGLVHRVRPPPVPPLCDAPFSPAALWAPVCWDAEVLR